MNDILLFEQIMKTEFVPKLVATVTTCCVLYLVLKVSANLLTVKTLANVGYFDTLVSKKNILRLVYMYFYLTENFCKA